MKIIGMSIWGGVFGVISQGLHFSFIGSLAFIIFGALAVALTTGD